MATNHISANPSQPCTFAFHTNQPTAHSYQKSMSAQNDGQTSGRKEARLHNRVACPINKR
jgi:hypothetical protein